MTRSHHKEPSQRQLRVGEQVRHVLAMELNRHDMPNPVLREASVTVTEVSMSPDLRHATAFVMPLGGYNKEEVLLELNEDAGYFNKILAKESQIKFSPKIRFESDETFEKADKIESLLNAAKRDKKTAE